MRGKRSLRSYAGLTAVIAAAAAITMMFTGGAGAVVAGAGFTTNDPNVDGNGSCLNGPASATPKVNCNLYGSKDYVWINGGPSAGQNHLTDGTYFFAVLDPGGQKDPNDGTDGNLSDVSPTTNTPGGDVYTAREFTVSGGKIAAFIGSGHDTDSFYSNPNGLFINLMPYDDTTNPGGVYILAICQLSTTQETAPITGTVTPSACKYDAFKAPASTCTENCDPTEFGAISGRKYYDANTNGRWDPGELPIAGWKIDYWDGLSDTLVTDSNGEFSATLVGDTYYFAEEHPTNTTGAPFNLPLWVQTGNIDSEDHTLSTGTGESASLSSFVYTVVHTDTGSTSGLDFGNVCLGAGGGLTLGFWSNKNGQATMNDGGTLAPELAMLSALNLRNADGGNFDPTAYAAFRTWILKATATNMAYMLSAQLAAMELNVEAGLVSGASSVYVAGIGIMTINDLMAAANTSLGTNGYTVAAGATRTYQEQLKNGLDAGNNNVNFVQQPSNGQLPACASTAISGWTTAFPTP